MSKILLVVLVFVALLRVVTQLGFGRFPGDTAIRRGNPSVNIPVTSILVTILLFAYLLIGFFTRNG